MGVRTLWGIGWRSSRNWPIGRSQRRAPEGAAGSPSMELSVLRPYDLSQRFHMEGMREEVDGLDSFECVTFRLQ